MTIDNYVQLFLIMYVIFFLSCDLLPTYRSIDAIVKFLDVIFKTIPFSIRFKVGTRGIQSVQHQLECSSPQSAGSVRLELHTVQTDSTSKPAPRWLSRISIEANKTADRRRSWRMIGNTYAARSRIAWWCIGVQSLVHYIFILPSSYYIEHASSRIIMTEIRRMPHLPLIKYLLVMSRDPVPSLTAITKVSLPSFSSFFQSSFSLSRFYATCRSTVQYTMTGNSCAMRTYSTNLATATTRENQ